MLWWTSSLLSGCYSSWILSGFCPTLSRLLSFHPDCSNYCGGWSVPVVLSPLPHLPSELHKTTLALACIQPSLNQFDSLFVWRLVTKNHILVQAWITWILIRGQGGVWESKNFCASYLTNFSVGLMNLKLISSCPRWDTLGDLIYKKKQPSPPKKNQKNKQTNSPKPFSFGLGLDIYRLISFKLCMM